MQGLLEGIRVVELGTMITAPLAAMMLGDLGADVIKVERPEGDPFRQFRDGKVSPHFAAYNKNKRSIALDLRQDMGRSALRKLIATADVVIDNFRPDIMGKLGFEASSLLSDFPRLVSCSITGFGPSGPYSGRPAFDAVAASLSGIYSLMLDAEHPQTSGPTLVDNITGMYASHGILAALHRRAVSGKGARIEINMLEAAISFIPDSFANEILLGITNGPRTRVSTSQSFAFKCADGRLLAVHLSSPTKFWESLIQAIGRSDLATDTRFVERDGRVKNFEALEAELAQVFVTKPRGDWLGLLERADVPFAPVQSISEVLQDPQVQHLETFYKTSHPALGESLAIEPPLWVDGGRGHRRAAWPELGEHTGQLLAECGYTSDEIEAFGLAEKV